MPKHYGVDAVEDIQVFAPVYKGELGIDALNRALRDALNPEGKPVGGGRLRIGDKLMMTGRNLHEKGLMNGTVLYLEDEIPGADGDEAALLLRSDEQLFRLPPEEAESLRLGYACSVHRGQGIELPVAVIVAHEQAGAFFLRREMLYTAITRAKLATVIVGSRAVVARAARTPDTDRRYSRLGERLLARSVAVATPASRTRPPRISTAVGAWPRTIHADVIPATGHDQRERHDRTDRVAREQRVPRPVSEQRRTDHGVERAEDRQPADVRRRRGRSPAEPLIRNASASAGIGTTIAGPDRQPEAARDLRAARQDVADRPREAGRRS